MNDILIFIGDVAIIIGIVIACLCLVAYFYLRRLNDRLEAELTKLVEQLEERIIPLEVELDNGQYYVYNQRDKQFICQATDLEDIIVKFQNRFPGKNAYFAEGEESVIATLTEQLKEKKLKDEVSSSQ